MTFDYTDDQLDIQQMVRKFAQSEIKPLAEELDKTGRFPLETIEKLAQMGIMGLNIPEEYGGSGADEITRVLVISEVARCCSSTAEILAVHLLVNDIIKRNGSEEQKLKYLKMAVSGKLGAFALTEPTAGSDAGGIRTRAVRDGEDYILNGTKCFISNLGRDEGDYVVVIAVTDPEMGKKGMSAFLVDRTAAGFSVGKTEDKMGIRAAAVSELILTDCRVPATNMLGQEGSGLKIALAGLDGGRIGIASQAYGLAASALECAIDYSKQRFQFGKPICELQGIQWYLAEMSTRLEASLLLTLRAAYSRQNGQPAATAASMAKYYSTENAVYICDRALQIFGGYGYMKDYPIERMYRDVRIFTLYEGTSEIQRHVIAKSLLK